MLNKATIVGYKDLVIRLAYKTEAGIEIKNDQFTINKLFPASSDQNFEIDIDNLPNCRILEFKVIYAVPY